SNRPPDAGGLRPEDFDRLPPPPPIDQAPPQVVVVEEREAFVRQRMLHVSLGLGDNLFRRGRFREAHRHFDLALNLAPGNVDLRLRIDRCRPYLPPPPVLLVVEAPPPPRARIAVLNFVVSGDPA